MRFLTFAILLTVGLFMACTQQKQSGTESSGTQTTSVTMYKNPGCQCCTKWAEHLEQNGFTVTEEPTPALNAIKAKYNVPYNLGACHTAIIGDYVVEGHVPVEDIKNLLKERPDAIGIAVPGMPFGSPGMEIPGRDPESYQVILFKKGGKRSIYAEHKE